MNSGGEFVLSDDVGFEHKIILAEITFSDKDNLDDGEWLPFDFFLQRQTDDCHASL